MTRQRSISALLLFLLPLCLAAQNSSKVVRDYRQSLEQIRTISYDVRQLDTFVTGHVWDYPGHVVLQKNVEDSLFGFHFMASKENINRGALYDGGRMFDIKFESKTYELDADPGRHILGSAGAQLIIPEMMYYQDSIVPDLSIEKGNYILTYHYPDLSEYSGTNRKKIIYLDKETHLPVKVVQSQVSLGKKQVITRIIKNTEITHCFQANNLPKASSPCYCPTPGHDRWCSYSGVKH